MREYKTIKITRVKGTADQFQLHIEFSENGHEYSISSKCLFNVGKYIVQQGLSFNPIAVFKSWDLLIKCFENVYGIKPEIEFKIMPKIQQIQVIDISPEKFLDQCTDAELKELDMLLDMPRFRSRLVSAEPEPQEDEIIFLTN